MTTTAIATTHRLPAIGEFLRCPLPDVHVRISVPPIALTIAVATANAGDIFRLRLPARPGLRKALNKNRRMCLARDALADEVGNSRVYVWSERPRDLRRRATDVWVDVLDGKIASERPGEPSAAVRLSD